MNGKKGLVALIVTVSVILTQHVGAAGKQVLLDELYEQASLDHQLPWMLSSMTLDYADYGLPVEVLNVFNSVVKVRYSPDYYRSSMLKTLDEALTMEELLELVEWYNSPLGKKILQLEAFANNPTNEASIERYIEERLSKQVPRSSRAELIQELMIALDLVEHGTELAATASIGVQRLLKEVMPVTKKYFTKPSPALKAREKPEIRREMQKKMKGILFYTFRTVSDEEIRLYLDFSRESAMKNFQRGQAQAIARML